MKGFTWSLKNMYTQGEKGKVTDVTAATSSVSHNDVGFADGYNLFILSNLSRVSNECLLTFPHNTSKAKQLSLR